MLGAFHPVGAPFGGIVDRGRDVDLAAGLVLGKSLDEGFLSVSATSAMFEGEVGGDGDGDSSPDHMCVCFDSADDEVLFDLGRIGQLLPIILVQPAERECAPVQPLI